MDILAVSYCAHEFQRNYGFMSMLGFSCTLMVTWEGVLMSVPSLIGPGQLLT